VKILVATSFTQGTSPDDYHYCVDGELVWLQEPCDRDKRNPDGPCGCGRGFAGAASHRATTTAMVVQSPLTRDDVVEWADNVADENLEIAAKLPAGTIIGRKLENYFLRGALLPAPSPEEG
jgi:hypothetical protein